jgi:hypothetical protein
LKAYKSLKITRFERFHFHKRSDGSSNPQQGIVYAGPRYDRIVICAASNAQGREFIGLRIESVEVIRVKVLGKRNKERIVPLLNFLLKLLQDYLNLRDAIANCK